MRNAKKYLSIALIGVVTLLSVSLPNVKAKENNSIPGQIEELRNTLNYVATKVESVFNDISGLKSTVSTQKEDIAAMKDLVVKQDQQIKTLNEQINAIKSQSGTNSGTATVKIASFSKTDLKTYTHGASELANKQVLITNMSNPQNTYTCSLDGSGNGEIKLAPGTYMFDFVSYCVYEMVVSPNIEMPKISIVQEKDQWLGGFGFRLISNLFHPAGNMVQGNSMGVSQGISDDEYDLLKEF